EHDPNEIWASQAFVTRDVLDATGVERRDVAAVAITNQRETTIVWDRHTGEPIHNAIVWQDRRTASMCDRLRADGVADAIRHKTGLVLDAYFSATKIAWLLEHVDGARERAERGELAFGTVDSWIAYKLTDGALHITDVSNASRTMLFDLRARDWDDELLAIFGVPRSMLPEVRSSSESYGDVQADVGLRGVPIAGIVGDQQAATMGQMCIEPGMAKNTYGTGCFLLMNVGHQPQASQHNLLTTVAWKRDATMTYALEGSVFIGGAAVQWLRDGLKIIESSSAVESLASCVDDNDDVYFVPALTGLGAPHWDAYARGIIIGLTRGTTDAHIARAALQGIAFSVMDLVTTMVRDAGTPMTELRVDGGASANNLLMQFQADMLGIPVVRPTVLETTALGAAYMAGLAVNVWDSTEAIVSNWTVDRRFEPSMTASRVQRHRERWGEAVQRARGWAREDNA
ncbi:MAG: glycerol kinase GlpK, partial [Planctomycetota bacterium]